MDFEIVTHKSVGMIEFGMTRAEVHALPLGMSAQFYRGGVEDTDHFQEMGVFVIYNDVGICIAVELTQPARAIFQGINLLSLPRTTAHQHFAQDTNLEKDRSGYTSYLFGVGAYYEISRKAETVIGFSPNYYE